jgi:hypothetical protein
MALPALAVAAARLAIVRIAKKMAKESLKLKQSSRPDITRDRLKRLTKEKSEATKVLKQKVVAAKKQNVSSKDIGLGIKEGSNKGVRRVARQDQRDALRRTEAKNRVESRKNK